MQNASFFLSLLLISCDCLFPAMQLLGGMDPWLSCFPSRLRLSSRQIGNVFVCVNSLFRSPAVNTAIPRHLIFSVNNWETSQISKLQAPVGIHPILVAKPPDWAMCPSAWAVQNLPLSVEVQSIYCVLDILPGADQNRYFCSERQVPGKQGAVPSCEGAQGRGTLGS